MVIAAIVEALQQALSAAPQAADKLALKFLLTGFWHYVPLLILIVGGGTWLLGLTKRQIKPSPSLSQLTIHSAVYGTGPDTDIDVTDVLQRQQRDALAVVVSNELFGKDPHFGVLKRLEIEYSYGNQHRIKVSRPENTRMVLPEDTALRDEIVRLAQGIKAQRSNEPRESSEEGLSARLTSLAHDLLALIRDAGPKHDHAAFAETARQAGYSTQEGLARWAKINGPRVEAIHYGYQARFVGTVKTTVNECSYRNQGFWSE